MALLLKEKLDKEGLSIEDLKAVEKLLSLLPHDPPAVDDIWKLIDKVWDELGCDNKMPDQDVISKFYRHPVWIIHSLFVEQDEVSMQHRHAISDWIPMKNFKRVLDYGGGGGTLARLIADKDLAVKIDVYEPYPNRYAIWRTADYTNVHFINTLDKNYDCIIATDVLEHVPDPLKSFSEIIESVKTTGCLIIANHFWPSVKCHLPATFHLRYTFNRFARMMGLKKVGPCKGSHATIYRKDKAITFDWRRIRNYERISRMLFPFLNAIETPIRLAEKKTGAVLRKLGLRGVVKFYRKIFYPHVPEDS